MPINGKAELDDATKKTLRWDQQSDFLARSVYSQLPAGDLDAAMLDVWTEFLQSWQASGRAPVARWDLLLPKPGATFAARATAKAAMEAASGQDLGTFFDAFFNTAKVLEIEASCSAGKVMLTQTSAPEAIAFNKRPPFKPWNSRCSPSRAWMVGRTKG